MSSWQTVKTVLDEALDQPAEERSSFLAMACGEDVELLAAVENLLKLEDESGEFLAEPIFSLNGQRGEDPNLGRQVGVFRLVRKLAGGGMGAVYLGERQEGPFEQRSAVKLIKRGMDSEEILHRFALERQILARLSHDSIARLLDGGTAEDGLPYFALEYVDGLPLDRYCAARQLTLDERLGLFLEICDAVAYAHRSLVIHRDLKPGNILVTPEGRPKLLDFGIAKLLTPHGAPEGAATVLGAVPMTPGYASPEQLKGQALTTATDVYSLGVILFELLTGRRPYQVDTSSVGAWLAAIEALPPRPSSAVMGTTEPPLPLELRPTALGPREPEKRPPDSLVPPRGFGLPAEGAGDRERLRRRLRGDLDRIVAKAMARDPAERYGSVAELAEDLALFREGLPIRSRPQTWSYRTTKFLRRHRLGVGVAAMFVLLLISSTTVMALQRRQIREERDRVAETRDRARAARDRLKRAENYLTEVFEGAGANRARDEELTARELFEHAAAKLEKNKSLPDDTRAVLLDVNGRVYRKLGLTKKSLENLEQALEIRRRALPADGPLLAETMTNLANTLRSGGGDEARIEQLLRDSVVIWRREPLDDKEDQDTFATTLANLASVLDSHGKPSEALPLFEEALAIKKRVFGENTAEYARTLNLLAVSYLNRGAYSQAEPMLRRVLEVRRQEDPLSNRDEVLTSLNNLAMMLLELGRTTEAKTYVDEDWPERKEIYSNNPGKLALGWISQGLLAEAEGRFIEARDAYLKAQALVRGDSSGHAASSRNLAALLSRHTELGDCEPHALAAVDHYRATHPGTWNLADAESVLGGCLMAKGRLDEAEPLIGDGYARLKELTQRRPNLPEARERLVELYRRTGREEKAAALLAEAAAPSVP